jgi:hypothetical protein
MKWDGEDEEKEEDKRGKRRTRNLDTIDGSVGRHWGKEETLREMLESDLEAMMGERKKRGDEEEKEEETTIGAGNCYGRRRAGPRVDE